MTLSHCWGTAEFLTLRESRKDDMKERIVWSSLPKTFQDAVTVTMWFKVKYLWIDSLCIIQDSHEDWQRESENMKHIYKKSYLTIAATNAIDAVGGLFVDRNPNDLKTFRVRGPWSRELECDYLLSDHNIWTREILESPLVKRAWAFQERLLSPRVLHFGRSQMLWECQDLNACETFPENLPPEIERSSDWESKRLFSLKDGKFDNDYWRNTINTYSKGSLTRISDKCVAFAGIVEEVQGFAQDRYLAGFWRHNLEQQLLWWIDHSTTASRPQYYLAQSWSWLSIEGAVTASVIQQVKVALEILDVSVTHFSDNVFGPIKHGYIRACGILGSAVLVRQDGLRWAFRVIRDRPFGPTGSDWISMDEQGDGTSRNAVYLPIFDDQMVFGLLLVPTGEAKDEYRRIGAFSVYDKILCKLMMKNETGNGVWEELPRRTFTLV